MTKTKTLLNEKFSIAADPIVTDVVLVEESTVLVPLGSTQDEQDFLKAQDTLTKLIDLNSSALRDLMRVAKESEQPRAYEVISQLSKTIAEISNDLVKLQKLRKDISGEPANTKGTKIDRQVNVFVGSTQDMIRAIQESEKLDAAEIIEGEIVSD